MKRLFVSALLCAAMVAAAFGVTAAAAENTLTASEMEAYGITCPDSESGRHTYVEDVTDATCTTPGRSVTKCSICGEVFFDTVIEATGHTAQTLPAVAPTCTANGLTEGEKCSVCGEILTAQQVIGKLAHTEQILPAREATCSATGLTEGKECSVCGEVLKAQETIDKLPHMLVTVPGKEATCTEDGYTEMKKCDVCGEVVVESVTIPASHIEETIPGKEPTCTEDGLTEGKKCSECGVITVPQEVIPALGHSFTGNVCDRCGEVNDTAGGGSDQTSGLDNVPKTGDITPYGLFVVMGMFAVAGMVWFVRKTVCAK